MEVPADVRIQFTQIGLSVNATLFSLGRGVRTQESVLVIGRDDSVSTVSGTQICVQFSIPVAQGMERNETR